MKQQDKIQTENGKLTHPFKDRWSKRYKRYIRLYENTLLENNIYKLSENLFYIFNKDKLMELKEMEIYTATKRQFKDFVAYKAGGN